MGHKYSKEFQVEPVEFAGTKVFGNVNGLSWLSPTQSMALNGCETVPQTHLKNVNEGGPPPSGSNEAAIPLFDLALLEGLRSEELKREIARACEEWGFFQVVNHGVDQYLVENYMELMKKFFSLPLEEKSKYFGTNFNSPCIYATRTKDWSDFLRLKCEPVTDPDISQWPEKPDNFRETAAEYCKQVTALARRLLEVLSESLGLTKGFLNEAFQAHSFTYINNNFYPVCPEPGKTLGLTGHSDPGGITILYQDEVGGLQVQKSGGPWVDVLPMKEALVINLADQIQILSNGTYRSGMHRVVVNSEQPRYSAAAVFSPDGEAKISPAKELVNSSKVCMYPEITFADYMVGYLKKGAYEKGFLNSLLLPTKQSCPTP